MRDGLKSSGRLVVDASVISCRLVAYRLDLGVASKALEICAKSLLSLGSGALGQTRTGTALLRNLRILSPVTEICKYLILSRKFQIANASGPNSGRCRYALIFVGGVIAPLFHFNFSSLKSSKKRSGGGTSWKVFSLGLTS